MIVKKIKDWLKFSKPQFEVLERFGTVGPIKKVKRLSDGLIFHIFSDVLYKKSEAKLNIFYEDFIHVGITTVSPKYGLEFQVENGKTKSKVVKVDPDIQTYSVSINDIEQIDDCPFQVLHNLRSGKKYFE